MRKDKNIPMTHVLAKITGVKPEDIRNAFKSDLDSHEQAGLHLEHCWQNAKDNSEIFFLFRSENMDKAEEFIKRSHTAAYMDDINANLPQMTFLHGVTL